MPDSYLFPDMFGIDRLVPGLKFATAGGSGVGWLIEVIKIITDHLTENSERPLT